MSTTSEQRQPASHGEPEGRPEGAGGFLRGFLIAQVVFLLFLVIASIPEAPSDYARVSAATQMAVVAALWAVTDVSAVAIHTLRVRAHRAGR